MGMFSWIGKKRMWAFVGGLAAGLVLPSVVRSKTAHKAAVNIVAKGMSIKDEAMVICDSVKEDAQDIYAEAKQKVAEQDCCQNEASSEQI